MAGGSNMHNWRSVAGADGWASPWDLIAYNFNTRDPREVNWFLYHFVGCRHSNDGNKNLSFWHANPGVIYTRNNLNRRPDPIPVPAVTRPVAPPPPPKPLFRRGFTWFGAGFQVGGMGLVQGQHTVQAYMVNTEDVNCRFLFSSYMQRVGTGFGASVSTVLVFINGLYHPEDVRYAPDGDIDFQAAAGARWLALAKPIKHVPNMRRLVTAARARRHIDDKELLAGLATSVKSICKSYAYEESTDLKVTVVDMPVGAGYEGSLYYEFGTYRASMIRLTPEPYELAS